MSQEELVGEKARCARLQEQLDAQHCEMCVMRSDLIERERELKGTRDMLIHVQSEANAASQRANHESMHLQHLHRELEAAQDFARKLQRGNSEMQNASNAMQERFNDTIHILQKEALEQQGHLKDELEAGRVQLEQARARIAELQREVMSAATAMEGRDSERVQQLQQTLSTLEGLLVHRGAELQHSQALAKRALRRQAELEGLLEAAEQEISELRDVIHNQPSTASCEADALTMREQHVAESEHVLSRREERVKELERALALREQYVGEREQEVAEGRVQVEQALAELQERFARREREEDEARLREEQRVQQRIEDAVETEGRRKGAERVMAELRLQTAGHARCLRGQLEGLNASYGQIVRDLVAEIDELHCLVVDLVVVQQREKLHAHVSVREAAWRSEMGAGLQGLLEALGTSLEEIGCINGAFEAEGQQLGARITMLRESSVQVKKATETELAKAQAELGAVQAESRGVIAKLSADKAALQERLDKTVEELEAARASMKSECMRLEERIKVEKEEMKSDKAALEERLDRTAAELEAVTAAMKSECMRLEDKIKDEKEEMKSNKAALEERLDKTTKELEAVTAAMKSERMRLEDTIGETRGELQLATQSLTYACVWRCDQRPLGMSRSVSALAHTGELDLALRSLTRQTELLAEAMKERETATHELGVTQQALEALREEHAKCSQRMCGIGMLLRRDTSTYASAGRHMSTMRVVKLVAGLPAAQSGLILIGDMLCAIDGEPVDDKELEEVSELIRGPEQSTVQLTLRRELDAEPFSVQLVRQFGSLPSTPTRVLSRHMASSGAATTLSPAAVPRQARQSWGGNESARQGHRESLSTSHLGRGSQRQGEKQRGRQSWSGRDVTPDVAAQQETHTAGQQRAAGEGKPAPPLPAIAYSKRESGREATQPPSSA